MPEPAACLVDANLLMWAHHEQFDQHAAAREWWATMLSASANVGVPWPSVLAFVRLSTNHRVFEDPIDLATAWTEVQRWLDHPGVWVPVATERHRHLLDQQLRDGQASGDHVMDAHLAALAIEWGLELLSGDRGFARFPGLRWRNPLA